MPAASWAGPLLLALALAGGGCAGSDPVDTDDRPAAVDVFALNRQLGRGVNFGNALEAPKEGEWGVTLNALHFQRAAQAGFRTIRLPVRWSTHAQTAPPYTVDDAFFQRVDWAIAQARANGLNVIVDFHHYEELIADPPAHRARWLAIWRQVATRYRSQPESVLFELLNEPNGALTSSLWNGYLREALAVIRETNPTRAVVVGPAGWNGVGALTELSLPTSDRHLIVTFHFYEPFQFTHQGASWASGSEAWLGTKWQATDAEKQFVTGLLERAAAWGRAQDRPVFLGEFGAYSAAELDSRVRWTAYVAREAERLGMSWAYWEFMSGFGIYDARYDTWLEPLKQALLPGGSAALRAGDSP